MIRISSNELTKFIAKRRWIRRLHLFDLPPKAWVSHKSSKFYVDPSDWKGPSYHVLNWGLDSYEIPNIDLIKDHFSQVKNAVFLDVGANVGIFSFLLAQECPDATIHAFEPDIPTFNCLQSTFSQPQFNNVHLHKMALTDKNEFTTLFSDSDNHGGHSLVSQAITDEGNRIGSSTEVVGKTMDEFVKTQGLDRVDFIKLDVQRNESKTLAGALATIEEFRPIVMMECYFSELLQANSPLLKPFSGRKYRIATPDTKEIYAVEGNLKDLCQGNKLYRDLVFFPVENPPTILS